MATTCVFVRVIVTGVLARARVLGGGGDVRRTVDRQRMSDWAAQHRLRRDVRARQSGAGVVHWRQTTAGVRCAAGATFTAVFL